MLHRTFAAAAAEAEGEQPSFSWRGHEFAGVPLGEVPAGVMLDMVAASQQHRGRRENTAALVAGLLQFIMSCLTEESAVLFDELTHRPWTVKPLAEEKAPAPGWTTQDRADGRRQVWRAVRDNELEELADWLTEVYAGVPTPPSSASSPASSAAGASSRAASSSAASPPNGSPQPYARIRDLEAEARAFADAGASWTGQPDPSSTSA